MTQGEWEIIQVLKEILEMLKKIERNQPNPQDHGDG